jgi:uncharacterized oxidoreductase
MMDFTKATILLTGGNSGIGRGLAEALAARGSRLIITGRDERSLTETLDANPGMAGYRLDVSDPAAIKEFTAKLLREHPETNVVIHNAGIMVYEDLLADPVDLDVPERTIASYLRLLIDTSRSMRVMPSQCSTSGISSWKRTSWTPATHSVRSK